MLFNKWILAGGAAIVAAGVAASAAALARSDHSSARPHMPTTSAATSAPSTLAPRATQPPAAEPGAVNPIAIMPSATEPAAAKPFATKKLTVQGVTFDVPTTWGLSPILTGATDCLTIGGVAVRLVNGASNCQLAVRVVSARGAAQEDFNLDQPLVVGDGAMCGPSTGAPKVTTVQATNATVGGHAAEYRSFTGTCFKGTWEQWTVPTAPAVILTRSYANPATEQAARYVVANAELPGPRSTLRLTDRGVIRSVKGEADGVRIELDRVTRLEQGGNSNTNPATYSYVLPANLQIRAATPDLEPLSVQQLVQLANGTTVDGVSPPLSTLGANLTTNGTTVTGMDLFIL